MADKKQRGLNIWIALLTFSAGFTNAEMTVGRRFSVSHHTGNLSQFAIALSEGKPVLFLAALIFFFFLGSTLAGVLFYKKVIGQSRIYGFTSIIHGIATILLGFFLPTNTLFLFILFQSFALGIQNGILKNVRHTTSRTTHMTGYLTDAGVGLGAFFRGDKRRLFVFVILRCICCCLQQVLFWVRFLFVGWMFTRLWPRAFSSYFRAWCISCRGILGGNRKNACD